MFWNTLKPPGTAPAWKQAGVHCLHSGVIIQWMMRKLKWVISSQVRSSPGSHSLGRPDAVQRLDGSGGCWLVIGGQVTLWVKVNCALTVATWPGEMGTAFWLLHPLRYSLYTWETRGICQAASDTLPHQRVGRPWIAVEHMRCTRRLSGSSLGKGGSNTGDNWCPLRTGALALHLR